MDPIEVHVFSAENDRAESSLQRVLRVQPTAPEDWKLSPVALKNKTRDKWETITLPGGETIDIFFNISTVNDSLSFVAKQDGKVIAELMCDGRAFATFLTLGNRVLGFQVFWGENRLRGRIQ